MTRRRSLGTRVLTTAAVLLSPLAAARAQQPAPQPAVAQAFLTSESVAAVVVRPKQVLTNPALSLLPIEVAEAAGEKYLGMPASSIVRAIAVGEPPLGATPYYAVFLQSDQDWDLGKLSPELTAHTQPGQIAGRDCLVSQHPAAPCLMVLKGKTLVAASRGMVEKLLDRERPKADGVLASLVNSHPPGDDLYVAVDLKALQPLIQLGLLQARSLTPPEFQDYLEIPTLLQSVELQLNFSDSRSCSLVVQAESSTDADALEERLADATRLIQQGYLDKGGQLLAAMEASQDPVEQATAAWVRRVNKEFFEIIAPKRDGQRFVIFDSGQQDITRYIANVALMGLGAELLVPAIEAANEVASQAAE